MAKRKSSKSNNTNNNNQEKKQKQVSEEEQLENDIKPELQILCEEEEKKATPSNAEYKNDIKLQEVHVNIDKLEKTDGENKPIKESEKSTESPELPNRPNEKSPKVENVLETNLEATDSQLCNINEDKLEQIPAKSYKENLGIDCADEKVKELVSTLSSMNRVIMDAKKDLASIRLKINHSTKSSKAI